MYAMFLWTNMAFFVIIILHKQFFQHTIRVPALL